MLAWNSFLMETSWNNPPPPIHIPKARSVLPPLMAMLQACAHQGRGPLCCKCCLFFFSLCSLCKLFKSRTVSCSPLHSWYLTQSVWQYRCVQLLTDKTHWRPRREHASLGVNNLNGKTAPSGTPSTTQKGNEEPGTWLVRKDHAHFEKGPERKRCFVLFCFPECHGRRFGTWPSSASNWMRDLAPAPHHLPKFQFSM